MTAEDYDEKHNIERDSDGKIIKRSLDPETARRMAAKRWEAQGVKHAGDVESLLAEGGWDSIEAPTTAVVLAETIAARGPRSVSAVREYLRMTRPTPEPGPQALTAAEKHYLQHFRLYDGLLALLAPYVDRMREAQEDGGTEAENG